MMYPQDSLPLCPDALVLATQPSVTHEFYQYTQQHQHQIQDQLAFQAYCQWYYEAAAAAQQDLLRMQHDINILGWFCRDRTPRRRSGHRPSTGWTY
ncbi:MAG: hypothetical protein AB4042_16390 [Leptolyngbyaceae cyanobacterium]